MDKPTDPSVDRFTDQRGPDRHHTPPPSPEEIVAHQWFPKLAASAQEAADIIERLTSPGSPERDLIRRLRFDATMQADYDEFPVGPNE